MKNKQKYMDWMTFYGNSLDDFTSAEVIVVESSGKRHKQKEKCPAPGEASSNGQQGNKQKNGNKQTGKLFKVCANKHYTKLMFFLVNALL